MSNEYRRLLLIGGNPLGHQEPFSEKTHSGKVLHNMVRKLGAEERVYYADIWENQEDEDTRRFDHDSIQGLWVLASNGWEPIALGRYQFNFLRHHLPMLEYLPHPASRRLQDIQALWKGLKERLAQSSYPNLPETST
jgi:hypothetical protein